MIHSILLLAVLGFVISFYTYTLEKKIKETPDYKPACDLSDRISCSRPIKSEYANLLSFSNAIAGMIFYVFIAILAALHTPKLLLIAAIGGAIVSCFLAYLVYFKIKSFCLVCTSIYIVNFLILVLALWHYQHMA